MNDPLPAPAQRCGLIAIVGRPNVGKSTLLNALVGQKVSITSKKAQTTRHRITGVRTVEHNQFVFVDTPGFQTRHGNALNRNLNRTVTGALADVDLVLLVVEAGKFGLDDAKVLGLMPKDKSVVLVANKLDTIHRRADLLPWLKSMQERHPFAEFVPLQATKNADVDRLFAILAPHLPEQPWFFEEDALTDRSERFLASELIREKLFRLTGGRLPLIGVGGIEDAAGAYAKVRAGASLLQLYSALVYGGPGLIGRILAGLAARLAADGFARLQDAVGSDAIGRGAMARGAMARGAMARDAEKT